jgi:hypothetical protein
MDQALIRFILYWEWLYLWEIKSSIWCMLCPPSLEMCPYPIMKFSNTVGKSVWKLNTFHDVLPSSTEQFCQVWWWTPCHSTIAIWETYRGLHFMKMWPLESSGRSTRKFTWRHSVSKIFVLKISYILPTNLDLSRSCKN